MYQLDANLCILASTLRVNCNFCVRFTFQQFFGKQIKALWRKTEEQERERERERERELDFGEFLGWCL